jgi:NAD-dependent dihydropyrimidine dehydrogenase PreA subunit
MAKRLAVVISQGQSASPAKRNLEEDVIVRLMLESGVDVIVVPHLYDLADDSAGVLALQGVKGHFVLISWLYERAARWALDRRGVRGRAGTTLLVEASDDDEDDDELEDEATAAESKKRVLDAREIPARNIYCIDFKASDQPQEYVDEVKRIFRELTASLVALDLGDGLGVSNGKNGSAHSSSNGSHENGAAPTAGNGHGNGSVADALARGASPAEALGIVPSPSPNGSNGHASEPLAPAELLRIEGTGGRRWYPVIDYSRCTNCMECIDFCLFGVYGVDTAETILVEQPDNCRKGCPACSRVCPENAIIFPQHKSPAIAGAEGETAGLKIDLSLLFGGGPAEDPVALAARERDEQLLLAGRDAVGLSVGIPKRQADRDESAPKDDLDRLIDSLDELDI